MPDRFPGAFSAGRPGRRPAPAQTLGSSGPSRSGVRAAEDREGINAFAALAERIDALAAERSRPWWRRLVG